MNRFSLSVCLNLVNPKPRELIHLTNLIYVANSCERHVFTYTLHDQNNTMLTTNTVSCRVHNMRILGYLSKENSVVPQDLEGMIREYRSTPN